MRNHLAKLVAAVLASQLVSYAVADAISGIRVDVNPDTDRKDALSKLRANWLVADGQTATKTFDGVTVTLRAVGPDARLAGFLWKGGFDTNAVMASDGVALEGAAEARLELVLSGLTPGRHSVVTYHNAVDGPTPGPYAVLVNGKPAVAAVRPTHRAANDDDSASAYVEVDAEAGRDVVIAIREAGRGVGSRVLLNGFEIDTADPARRTTKPQPADRDEHAVEVPVLSWVAPKSVARHRVYLGTDRAAVAAATPQSAEFKGETTATTYATRGLRSNDAYFWRVDAIAADGTVTPGDLWSFRVRHDAFPGAEGYGRYARGGRGGKVYEVTTLADSGPGSLREAVEASGPRTVVFRVGGTIRLKSKLVIRNPYITIAGQTAPGDGICVGGFTFGNYGTHDTVIRYVRIRVGDEAGTTMDGTGFASSDHCIMDHCSVSWSIDEGVSSRGAKNITFQRGLVARALNVANHAKYGSGKGHSFAGSISGKIGSFHHNLVAHCAGRNWSLAGGMTLSNTFAGYLDLRNNVVYNWQHRTNDGGVKALNLVNNYYIPGPASRVFHLLQPDVGTPDDRQQYYVSGNVMEGRPQYDADNWQNGGVDMRRSDARTTAEVKLDQPFCSSLITEHSAKAAYDSVIADSGANWPKLDSHDQRVLDDVVGRTATFKGSKTGLPGIIDSQKDAGGWPDLKGAAPPPDTDHDGMPDAWEKANGLDPADPVDGNGDAVGDGYTNLERYLNGIVADRGRGLN